MQRLEGEGWCLRTPAYSSAFAAMIKYTDWGRGMGGGGGCLKQQSLSQSSGDLKFKIKVSAGLLPAEG